MNTADKYYFDPTNKHTPELEKSTRLLFNWSDCVSESEKEYSERVRKIKLLSEMKNVISNELDDTQKEVLRLRYVEAKSFDEIAAALIMSSSAAKRCLSRAEYTIGTYMKYVFSFSQKLPESADKPLDVKKAVASLFLTSAAQDKIARRIKSSRTERFISVAKAAACTGINKERLLAIEQSGIADTTEIKKLITFYGVSADYIFFGVD